MTHLNRIWSILAKGATLTAQEYARRTSPKAFNNNPTHAAVIDILVPYNDVLLQAHQIDELVKLVLMSSVRERALEFDPINTYEKAMLINPEPGNFTDLTTPEVVFTTDPTGFTDQGQGIIDTVVTINPTALSYTSSFENGDFTYTNNLTSPIILLDKFSIRLRGVLGSSDFTFDVRYVVDPKVDWDALLVSAQLREYEWSDGDLRNTWLESPNWVDKLAALTLSTVELAAT